MPCPDPVPLIEGAEFAIKSSACLWCGCREFDITEIDITETAITEFDITDTAITESDITESDITRKGKLL